MSRASDRWLVVGEPVFGGLAVRGLAVRGLPVKGPVVVGPVVGGPLIKGRNVVVSAVDQPLQKNFPSDPIREKVSEKSFLVGILIFIA